MQDMYMRNLLFRDNPSRSICFTLAEGLGGYVEGETYFSMFFLISDVSTAPRFLV